MSSYSLGLKLVRWAFRIPLLAAGGTAFARIWLRHARWRAHLRAFQFDGVIDGGANIGEFAQAVRDALPQAHLLCIEPHPACATTLRKQGFEVIEAALWSEKTRLHLFQEGPSTLSTVMKSRAAGEGVEVEAVRLSDLPIRGERLLVKLDLQGAELAALQALGDLEKRCAGFLVEVALPPNGTYEEVNAFFATKNFVPFASVNELFSGNRQVEADLLWIRRDVLG